MPKPLERLGLLDGEERGVHGRLLDRVLEAVRAAQRLPSAAADAQLHDAWQEFRTPQPFSRRFEPFLSHV